MIVVLAYHSHNIFGAGYAENDHVALRSDLETITRFGGQVVPLTRIVEALATPSSTACGKSLVGLSFDDGPLFDFEDFEHPSFGPQRSLLNILRDFRNEHGVRAQPDLHATSFVIASPSARKEMERAEECGYPKIPDWLTDRWWGEAFDTGLLGIGNHSWDHVHGALSKTVTRAQTRNDFSIVDNYRDADLEIRAASEFINVRTGGHCSLFAFPFGHVNPYLVESYLPGRQDEHRMIAAFGVGGPDQRSHDVWNIPRLVCGHHWKTPEALEAILAGAR